MSNSSVVLITPEFRMSFCHLVKARAYQENGKPKGDPVYSTEMIFDPEALGQFKRHDEATDQFVDVNVAHVCAEVAKAEWGDDFGVKAAVESKDLAWPIIVGDAVADKRERGNKKHNDHYRGMKVIKGKSSEEVGVRLYYNEGGERKMIQRGLESDERKARQLFQSGSYAYAEVSLKPQIVSGTKYITFYLNSVRWTRTGERIGGSSMMDRYDGVHGTQSDHDPTKGMNDDIPA